MTSAGTCSRFMTDMGIVGPNQGKGGKYLVLPPGCKGEVPAGAFAFESRKNGIKTKSGTIRDATDFKSALAVASAGAQPQGSDAKSILKKMSAYVRSQETIELTLDSGSEVIFPQPGKMAVARPRDLQDGSENLKVSGLTSHYPSQLKGYAK